MDIDSHYTRVTEVISHFSGIKDIPEDVLKKAADKGTAVHKAIEGILKDEFYFTDPNTKMYIDCFLNWYESFKLSDMSNGEIIIEERLYCPNLMITGCVDLIVKQKEKTYLFDWKTSSQKREKSWRLQGAAYKYLAEVNGFENVETPIFVKLNKKNATQYKFEEYEKDFSIFKACLDVYRYFN